VAKHSWSRAVLLFTQTVTVSGEEAAIPHPGMVETYWCPLKIVTNTQVFQKPTVPTSLQLMASEAKLE